MNESAVLLDVLIIGAGPIGLACGIEASRAGLNYLIVEKGCLTNSLFHYPVNMTFFSTADRLEIGNVPFIANGAKPVRSEALNYYRHVAMHWKLNISLYEKVVHISPRETGYKITTGKREVYARNIIMATGFFDMPHLMRIKGEDLEKVKHYYDEAHRYAFQKIAVVGAANSAAYVALETFREGAEVTMIIREAALSDSVKYWIKPDLENRIAEGSIKAYFNAQITEILENEIVVSTPGGKIRLANDFVLAMTGYQPDFGLLQRAGVQLSTEAARIPVYNPDTHETNQPGIYLAGVICGGLQTSKWFIENSIVHAEIIMKDITGKIKNL